jgi:AAA+ ATPase superfamily predicted ATPase
VDYGGIMKFVGRRAELQLLEEHYAAGPAALIPIYGRRRVGKSRLIEEFVKGKPSLSFLGKRTTAEMQLNDFRDAAQKLLQNEALVHARFKNWQDALQTVTRLWRHSRKLVLVLDELQWTAEASPELPSILQALWDLEWKKAANLMVILCGSHVGFMERDILGSQSPLFGRRSDQIKLGPLPFYEALNFVDHYSAVDRVGAYFLVGGIPAYLERFSPGRSLPQAITDEFCSEFKFFAMEPNFLVREELRDPARYFAILTLLAEKRMRQRDLAEASHIEARALAAYLGTLMDLGYVAKYYPATPGKASLQAVQYEVADPLLQFWFRFIFPNLQLCRPGQEKAVFAQCIRPHLDSYFGSRFEKLCQEWLRHHYQRENILWRHIGQYWDPEVQIDVVGVRQDNWIDLGECKWGPVKSVKSVAEALDRKLVHYPCQGCSLGRHVFLRDARVSRIDNTLVHSLAHLINEAPGPVKRT